MILSSILKFMGVRALKQDHWHQDEAFVEYVSGMNERKSVVIAKILKEQIRSESFRLKYESLKNLHFRLRHQAESARSAHAMKSILSIQDPPWKEDNVKPNPLLVTTKSVQTYPEVAEDGVQKIKEVLPERDHKGEIKAAAILKEYQNYRERTMQELARVTKEYDEVLVTFNQKLEELADQNQQLEWENRRLALDSTRTKNELTITKEALEGLMKEGQQSEAPKITDNEGCVVLFPEPESPRLPGIEIDHFRCKLEERAFREREETLYQELATCKMELFNSLKQLEEEREEHGRELSKLRTELAQTELKQNQMQLGFNRQLEEVNLMLQQQTRYTEDLTKFIRDREFTYDETKRELNKFVENIMKNSKELVAYLQETVELRQNESKELNVLIEGLDHETKKFQDLSRKYGFLITSFCDKVKELILGSDNSFVDHIQLLTFNYSAIGANQKEDFDFQSTLENAANQLEKMLRQITKFKQEASSMIQRSNTHAVELRTKLNNERETNMKQKSELRRFRKELQDHRRVAKQQQALVHELKDQCGIALECRSSLVQRRSSVRSETSAKVLAPAPVSISVQSNQNKSTTSIVSAAEMKHLQKELRDDFQGLPPDLISEHLKFSQVLFREEPDNVKSNENHQ